MNDVNENYLKDLAIKGVKAIVSDEGDAVIDNRSFFKLVVIGTNNQAKVALQKLSTKLNLGQLFSALNWVFSKNADELLELAAMVSEEKAEAARNAIYKNNSFGEEKIRTILESILSLYSKDLNDPANKKQVKQTLDNMKNFITRSKIPANPDGPVSEFNKKLNTLSESNRIFLKESDLRKIISQLLIEEKTYKDPAGDENYIYKRSETSSSGWQYQKKGSSSWKNVNSAGAISLNDKYGDADSVRAKVSKTAGDIKSKAGLEKVGSGKLKDKVKSIINNPKFKNKYSELIPIGQEFPDDPGGLKLMDVFKGAGLALQGLSFLVGVALSPIILAVDKLANIPIHFRCLGEFIGMRTAKLDLKNPKLKRAMYYVCKAAEKRGARDKIKGKLQRKIGYVDYMAAQELDPNTSNVADTWGGGRSPSLKTNNPYVALSVTFGKTYFKKNGDGSYVAADRYDYNLKRNSEDVDEDFINTFVNLRGITKEAIAKFKNKKLVSGVEELLVAYEVFLNYKGFPLTITTSKPTTKKA
jgi:hypothetical protein